MGSTTRLPDKASLAARGTRATAPPGPNLAEALLLMLDTLDHAHASILRQHPRETQWAEEALQSLTPEDRADLIGTLRCVVRGGRYRGDARKLAERLSHKLAALAPVQPRRDPVVPHPGVWDPEHTSALRARLRGWLVENTYSPVLEGTPPEEERRKAS